jgi:hypothetical protein
MDPAAQERLIDALDPPGPDPLDLLLITSGLRREDAGGALSELGRAVDQFTAGLPTDPTQRENAHAAAVCLLRDQYGIPLEEARRLLLASREKFRTNGHGTGGGPVVAPVRLDAFLDEDTEDAAADWIVPGIFGRGIVTGVAGKPKVGKTTWLTHAGVAIAEGMPFLGLATPGCPVLWLNLETSKKLARWKLRKVAGSAGSEAFYIVNGTRADCTLPTLEGWIRELGIGLLMIDSLSKWWAIEEENSGTQTTAALDLAVQLARRTNCGVVLIHHTRKNRDPGASVMDMFRGSGAIGAALDVGLVLSKHGDGDPALRVLEAESRYDETPAKWYIRLGQYTYDRVEDPGGAYVERERAAVAEALTAEPQTLDELAQAIPDELSDSTVRRRVGELVEQGKAQRGPKRGRALTWCLPGPAPAAVEAA